MSSDGTWDITGIAGGDAPEASEGRVLILMNIGANNIVLNHEDGASAAANQFKLPGATDLTLLPDESVQVWWDVTTDKWRVMNWKISP